MFQATKTEDRKKEHEKIIFTKKGNMKFYACLWDCGMYSIERITKAIGMTVATFETLEDLEKYANGNGYKIII